MPADIEERRKELRVSLPIQASFNRLKSVAGYTRADTALTTALELSETVVDLEARDDLERFLKRMDQKLDVILSLLADKIGRKEYKHKAVVMDISESGIRIVSPVALPVGTAVELGLVLPNQPYRTMDLAGEVIWEQDYTGKENPPYNASLGIRFTDILPHDQDEIVYWLFEKQREELRRRRYDE